MKSFLLLLVSLVFAISSYAQNTDLPGPTPNLQTLPNGSYIIPMDNTLQTDNIIGAGNFNLASYGLIVYLLNNNIKVKWVIKAGKIKDGIDFTGDAEQLKPTFVPGAVSRNFIAGPFVIFAGDTAGVAAIIDSFYTASSLTGNNRPRVFRLQGSVANVDIRYNLTGFKPKAAILTDGGFADVHVKYMTASKIPVANYMTAKAPDLLNRCFTFASEPHNSNEGPVTDSNILAIKKFTEFGGNFLAQCRAVENYENNPLGRFQTTTGITKKNDSIATNLSYPNPDLSFSQFENSLSGYLNGSLRNWVIKDAKKNNEHNHATGTGAYVNNLVASVSKMKTGAGGLIFYVGNHEFKTGDGIPGINGIRMYMNAFLTPVTLNMSCNIGDPITPLPVKLMSFTAVLNNNRADLKWITAGEMNVSHFVIEKSTDGANFSEAGLVFAYGNAANNTHYSFSDNLGNTSATVIYYRLRSVDTDGKTEYSETRMIRISRGKENTISILAFPNPVFNELRITIPAAWQNKAIKYQLYNMNGQVVSNKETGSSSQTETMNVDKLAPGIYLIKTTCGSETAQQKVVIQ